MQAQASVGCRFVFAFVSMCVACCWISVGALALSDGRVYELVSPVYKGGYGANGINAVAPDGERVVFTSLGSFEGDPANNTLANDYLAHRGVSGWATTPLTMPATLSPLGQAVDFSPTLESSLNSGIPGPNASNAFSEGTEFEYLLHNMTLPDTLGEFEVAGKVLKTIKDAKTFVPIYQGASPDFSHITFEAEGESLLHEAVGTLSTLYDVGTQSLGGVSSLKLVEVNNKGKALEPKCSVALGGGRSRLNAVAGDGGEVFFTTGVNSECTGQLFVRVGGARTLEVSRPLSSSCGEVPCGEETADRKPAEFQGASEDGSSVFFTTSQPLVNEDKDTSNDLYMAKIGCRGGGNECEPSEKEVTSLAQVSHGDEPADVQGVVTVASDGSHVYFVARGVLRGGTRPENGAPVEGADNLYMYDAGSDQSPVFIADLCSGSEQSGEVEDLACPLGLSSADKEVVGNDSSLWVTGRPEAQTNDCSQAFVSCESGRFLVFSAYARLARGDVDNTKDVYRYDALTGSLDRVSGGEAGYDANGNGQCESSSCDSTIAENLESSRAVYEQHDLSSRAVSEDGSRIVFKTAEPLSPDAVNGLANVYEWQEASEGEDGSVSLISTGSSDELVENVVISQTGNDVFFKTSQGLVAQDTDGQSDIYDARLHGGFPSPPAPTQPCSGDACQGPLTNPVPLLVPGSVSQAPGGDFPPLTTKEASSRKAKKPKTTARKKNKPKHRRKGRGKASLRSSRARRSNGGSK